MRNQRYRFGRFRIIGLCLLLALLGSCGRDHGQAATTPNQAEIYIIEPYTGPCPAGQSSWDCMAWNQDNWE
jgi:hypothetical protein